MAEGLRTRTLAGLDALDRAVYSAVAGAPTPNVDRWLCELSNAANYSQIWLGIAATLALVGTAQTRRAARLGLLSLALASATANLVGKPLFVRARPDRVAAAVPLGRYVRMPRSTSLPSGHAASAVAFTAAVGAELPRLRVPLGLLGAAVAYSRVHTGVHYPSDVLAGSLIGWGAARTIRRLSRTR